MTYPNGYQYHYDYEWTETAKGNFVIVEDGAILATVFRNKNGDWQIMLPGEFCSRLVKNEWYQGKGDAMQRTEEILQGAPYLAMNLLDRT